MAQAKTKERQMFSVDVYSGAPKMTIQELARRDRPGTITEVQEMCRKWHGENWFVEAAVGLRTMFYNYGLRIVPAPQERRPTKTAPKTSDKLKDWLAAEENAGSLLHYIDDVWNEWSLQDSVVSFWLGAGARPLGEGGLPWLILPEACNYTNTFGNEVLKVRMGVSREELKGSDLTAAQVNRYAASEVTFRKSDDTGEHFQVLTRGMRFRGFGTPRLRRVFTTLLQMESMEVGESGLAFGGRLPIRFHSLGFEVRSAAASMKQSEYMWNQKRANAIKSGLRGRQGFVEMDGNFDHKISYIWVDPKFYDARKWDTILQRLIWWAGPAAFLLIAKQGTNSDNLFQFLKAEALANRRRVGGYLERVLNASGALPCPVRLRWSNRCFNDPRLGWQMAQSLLQTGPLSPQTALSEADFDPEDEAELKEEAAKKPKLYTPIFDAAHGTKPGAKGRPEGTKDGDVVK